MNTSVDHDTAAMSSASPDVNSSSHTDGTGQVNKVRISSFLSPAGSLFLRKKKKIDYTQ